jgi:hypothetical protein
MRRSDALDFDRAKRVARAAVEPARRSESQRIQRLYASNDDLATRFKVDPRKIDEIVRTLDSLETPDDVDKLVWVCASGERVPVGLLLCVFARAVFARDDDAA